VDFIVISTLRFSPFFLADFSFQNFSVSAFYLSPCPLKLLVSFLFQLSAFQHFSFSFCPRSQK